jgi:hypothetical protein
MTSYIVEDVEGPPTSGYTVEDVSGPPDKSVSLEEQRSASTAEMPWYKKGAKALALSAELALRGSDATRKSTGLTYPSLGGRLADTIHEAAGLDNYQPASAAMGDSNRSVPERLSYAPRALLEGSVGLMSDIGIGGVTGGAGLMLNNANRNFGPNLETAKANSGSKEEALSRALAATSVDALLSRFGIEQTLARPGVALGTQAAKNVAKGIAITGAENTAQTAVDKNLLEGKAPTPGDLAVSGITGAGTSAAFKGLRGDFTDAGEAYRFRQFAGDDPKQLATVARLLRDTTDPYSKITEANAGDVLKRASGVAKDTLKNEAKDRYVQGPDVIARRVDDLRSQGRTDVTEAYIDVMAAANRGEPVNPTQRDLLAKSIGGDEVGQRWLNTLDQTSILGKLGDIGSKDGESGRMGGLHATQAGKTLSRLSGYFGLGSIGGGIGLSALGHSSLGQLGTGIGVGANALNIGVRAFDKASGYSNPVGRFARRFADAPDNRPPVPPVGATEPAAAIMDAVGAPPATTLPRAPVTTPETLMRQSMGIAPGENPSPTEMDILGKLISRAQAQGRVLNMGPKPGESMTTPPSPEQFMQRGADLDFRRPPPEVAPSAENLAKIDALVRERQRSSTQVEPSEAFKATKAAAMARRNARQAIVAKTAPRSVEGSVEVAPDKRNAVPSEELFPEAPMRGLPPEPPIEGSSPVDPKLLAMNAKIQRMFSKPEKAQSGSTRQEAPKQQKQDAPQQSPMSEMFTTDAFGVPVSIPMSEIRRTPEAWARGVQTKAGMRKGAVDQMKTVLPKDLHEEVDTLFKHWMQPGTKMVDAQHALEELVNDPRVPDELKSRLLDIWSNNSALTDSTHWE